MSLFDKDLKEVIDKGNNVRYILRNNPIRTEEIRQNTQDKIDSLEKNVKSKIEYYNTHFNAKKETLEKNINKKISDLKLSSFISYNITYTKTKSIFTIKGEDVIKTKELAKYEMIVDEKEKNVFQELDGCYVVKTSLTDTSKDSKEDIHKAYKTLIKVENAFKTLKTDFLEIRPLYIKTDKRIKGHVALSMLSYNISLKLKNYINQADLDFKDTIGMLSDIKTTTAQLTKKIIVNYIPKVNKSLENLFKIMNFTMPNKVNY